MVRSIRICQQCQRRRFVSSIQGSLACGPCAVATAPTADEEADEDQKPMNVWVKNECDNDSSPHKPNGSTQIECIDLISSSDDDDNNKNKAANTNEPNKADDDCKERNDESVDKNEHADEDADDPPVSAEDEDDDILADFPDDTAEEHTTRAFQMGQQSLHATKALVVDIAVPYHRNDNNNKNLFLCLACGSNLSHIQSGYKGRLNHIKRCSKSRGITVKDVIDMGDSADVGDDWEDTSAVPTPPPQPSTNWHTGSTTTTSAPTSKVRTLTDMLMAGARRAAKTEKIKKQAKENQRKRPKYSGGTFNKRSYMNCPIFKRIPHTDFIVDGFQYANTALTSNYFLTHFHSDHYGGIDGKQWNAGTIYCNSVTANLVHEQLQVDRKYLHPLPMQEPTVVESRGVPITVTLLHANHCPGAVMILFQVKQKTILHVGDFRWNYQIMSAQPELRPYCRKPWTNETSAKHIDELFLDTTYCDAKYDLPTQAECIQGAIAKAVKEVEEARVQKQRLLMLFGAYTIGKEAVYMSVAKRLGLKVYVDKRRFKILSALEWPQEDMALLTMDPSETIIWVVPLGHINMKKMPPYQHIRKRGFSRDFDRVVGFRPTGWSLSSKRSKKDVVGITTSDCFTVYSVPYSEHSSFPELVECLESLNPRKIIPTVSVATSEEQLKLLRTYWSDKTANLL